MMKTSGTTASNVYGAYGSNMNVRQMRMRCPRAKVIGVGTLHNYQLTFRGGLHGVANVERKHGCKVPIVLWKITPECEQALDVYEGFPRLYVKRTVPVVTAAGERVSAMIYVMVEQYEGCPAYPSHLYVRTIWQGYHDHGLGIAPLVAAIRENERELGREGDRRLSVWWKQGGP